MSAYWVRRNGADQVIEGSELKSYLARELPGFMIPAYFIQLDEIPLTANGKPDLKSLPIPGAKPGDDYLAPVDEVEEKLVGIWSEILGVQKETVGVKDNFFDLGGNSLKVMQLQHQVGIAWGVDIPAVKLFKYATIQSFVSQVLHPGTQPYRQRTDRSEKRTRGKTQLRRLKEKMKER